MEKLETYRQQIQGKNASQILQWALNEFGRDRIALATAFGLESQVITHHLVKIDPNARIFTIDTGRLFQETYDVMQQTMDKYNIKYEVYAPDPVDLNELMALGGPNQFYKDVQSRKRCCEIRKVRPLKKVLSTVDVWITGLRHGQSETRRNVEVIEWDMNHEIYKLNPLAHWREGQVWDYIKINNVPYNQLQDYGYRSIGCACCTRAIASNEHIRVGRWWWESEGRKECGLHPAPEYQI